MNQTSSQPCDGVYHIGVVLSRVLTSYGLADIGRSIDSRHNNEPSAGSCARPADLPAARALAHGRRPMNAVEETVG